MASEEPPQHPQANRPVRSPSSPTAARPSVRFIIDVSSLTKGLGNIRKWLETDHAASDLTLFVPSYTIHELDFQKKKGVSMAATNARESIRYIERVVTSDDYELARRVLIETPEEAGPKWKDCMCFKIKAPKMWEVSPEGAELVDPEERAELPGRLRFLIRALVQKVHIDTENWVFVTEDHVTRVWAESFRIPCINVSEADSILFHVNNHIDEQDGVDAVIPKLVSLAVGGGSSDTSDDKKQKKRRGRKPKSTAQPIKHQPKEVKVESFETIEFAPRGKGALWAP